MAIYRQKLIHVHILENILFIIKLICKHKGNANSTVYIE